MTPESLSSELTLAEAEAILTELNCPFVFKWKVPSLRATFFMWRKCFFTDSYRLFLLRDTKKTMFCDTTNETQKKFLPFLEEFIADFRIYATE